MTNDATVNSVVTKQLQRAEVGMKKYGQLLRDAHKPTKAWLQDTQEELMDAVVYLEKYMEVDNSSSLADKLVDFIKTFEGAKSIRFCQTLIAEEGNEVMGAIDQLNMAFTENDYGREQEARAHLLKELCDLVYVCVYAAVAQGMNFDEALRRVHESNMSKLEDGKVVRRADGKVLKGKDYKPPNLKDLV